MNTICETRSLFVLEILLYLLTYLLFVVVFWYICVVRCCRSVAVLKIKDCEPAHSSGLTAEVRALTHYKTMPLSLQLVSARTSGVDRCGATANNKLWTVPPSKFVVRVVLTILLHGWFGLSRSLIYYFRQVNEVNGGYNVFVRFVCLSVFLCMRTGTVNQTSLKRALNANSSQTVKDMDLTFDVRVPRDSPDMTP